MRIVDIMHHPIPGEPWFDLVDYCEKWESPVPVLSALASWLLEELCNYDDERPTPKYAW